MMCVTGGGGGGLCELFVVEGGGGLCELCVLLGGEGDVSKGDGVGEWGAVFRKRRWGGGGGGVKKEEKKRPKTQRDQYGLLITCHARPS